MWLLQPPRPGDRSSRGVKQNATEGHKESTGPFPPLPASDGPREIPSVSAGGGGGGQGKPGNKRRGAGQCRYCRCSAGPERGVTGSKRREDVAWVKACCSSSSPCGPEGHRALTYALPGMGAASTARTFSPCRPRLPRRIYEARGGQLFIKAGLGCGLLSLPSGSGMSLPQCAEWRCWLCRGCSFLVPGVALRCKVTYSPSSLIAAVVAQAFALGGP